MFRRHRVAQDAAGRGPCRRTPAGDTMSDGPCTTGGERGKGVTLTLGTPGWQPMPRPPSTPSMFFTHNFRTFTSLWPILWLWLDIPMYIWYDNVPVVLLCAASPCFQGPHVVTIWTQFMRVRLHMKWSVGVTIPKMVPLLRLVNYFNLEILEKHGLMMVVFFKTWSIYLWQTY